MAPLLELTDSDRLRVQARGLIERAEELMAEAAEIFRDADALDGEARDSMRYVAVRGRPPLSIVHADEDFQGRVCDALRHSEGLSTHALAEHIGSSETRVRAALKRLEESGTVVHTGAFRTSRWYIAGTAEPEPEPVRTGTATLRVFTKTTPERELQDREVAWTTEAPRG